MDIYNTQNWAASTSYIKNSIVTVNNLFYYSLVNHTSSSNFATDLSANKWGGRIDFNGQSLPYFHWQPSYNYSFDIKPSVKKIQFGEGYGLDVQDGINNILLPFDVEFNDRDLNEYGAILHFLHAQNGVTRFFYILPAPYGIIKKFVCQQWSPSQQFYDKYSIECLFEERA